jgi:hypothetical protein
MVPLDVDEMVIDWPELLESADGPVDLAMRLKEKFNLPEDFIPADSIPLPASLPGPGAQPTSEAQFL